MASASRIWLVFAVATSLAAATVPAGTQLEVRLTTEASSEKPSGQPVSAVLIAPVYVNNSVAIATGAQLTGATADAVPEKPATDQAAEQPATLRIQFTHIADQAGHAQPLFCVLKSVDNARESVNDFGLITGITPSQTFEARLDQGINKVGAKYQSFGQILSTVKSAFFKQVDASIDYKPGIELELALTKPLDWTAPPPNNPVADIAPADALTKLVASEPFRTVAENPPKPSDIVNLMFLGTADQIKAAFEQAGWSSAAALNQSAKVETARAIVEDRGYQEAPMSILFLDSKPPEFTFQKQNDTFEMRHHIRIWQRPQDFQGKPVWLAAATHDIKFTLSPVSKSFTHGIDPDIDKERSKVVNDLLFTGKVHGLALVERTGIPQDATNATGDKLATDGKIAVLEF